MCHCSINIVVLIIVEHHFRVFQWQSVRKMIPIVRRLTSSSIINWNTYGSVTGINIYSLPSSYLSSTNNIFTRILVILYTCLWKNGRLNFNLTNQILMKIFWLLTLPGKSRKHHGTRNTRKTKAVFYIIYMYSILP